MAAELQAPITTAGYTVYAILRNASGQVWNGSAFAAFSEANRNAGAITLTEQTGTAFYVGDLPGGVTAHGRYKWVAHRRAGGSPALSDTPLFEDWLDVGGVALRDGSIKDATMLGGSMLHRTSCRFGGAEAVRNTETLTETYKDASGTESHVDERTTVNGVETVTRSAP